MELYPSYRVHRKLPVNYKTEDRQLFEHELEKEFPKIDLLVFNRVTAFPESYLIQGNKELTNVETRIHPQKNLRLIIKKIQKKSIHIPQAVWIMDFYSANYFSESSNYFHWLTEVLTRLYFAQKELAGVPIILPSHLKKIEHVVKSLAAFSKTPIIWLNKNEKAEVKQLYYIPHTAPYGNYNEEILREVREILRNYFQLKQDPKLNIFISREIAPRRKIINWGTLQSLLNQKQIIPVIFETLDWQQQIQLSSTTKFLICVHGAGLTNMFFLPPDSHVLELKRRGDKINNCYFSLASALNLSYYYLLCDVDDENKRTQENDFFVNQEELEDIINSII
ncbi:MAG: glycosyltransferase family 61 protein [Hormoscilla sp. GM7CHS1pb]|nr:glycosyltransferase family 61 protein [Hormoscilla sp. GM7CHS1pb]